MVFDTHAINHHIYKDALDPFKTLEHLMLMVTSPGTLVAVSNFPPNNLRELVARAKAEPGKVSYASVGSASSNHLGAQLPELPTLAETYPGLELVSWFGLLAPAGVPKDITARIRRDMQRALEVPEIRQKLIDGGFDVVASSPEEFLRFAQGESDKLGKLIRENNIKVE
jgi:tripartite-type tricarboxylate transporter receptor subunit TctC